MPLGVPGPGYVSPTVAPWPLPTIICGPDDVTVTVTKTGDCTAEVTDRRWLGVE